MKSLFSYLLTIFDVFFWIFRIVVAIGATLKWDIGIEPIDMTMEVILLFVTLVAIVLIIRRNLIGAIVYFAAYSWYFGQFIYTQVMAIIDGTMAANQYMNLLFAIIGVLLAVFTLIDVLFNKNRTNTGTSKKTDWFYKNEQFDRKFDDRADKNNYRTM